MTLIARPAPAEPPLVTRLVESQGAVRLDEANYDAFLGAPGEAALFLHRGPGALPRGDGRGGDPARARRARLAPVPHRRAAPAARQRQGGDLRRSVRELKNVLEGAVIASPGPEIGPEDLPLSPAARTDSVLKGASRGLVSLDRLEESYIREVLRVCRGNKTEAARILGINRKTLLEKRKRNGIP